MLESDCESSEGGVFCRTRQRLLKRRGGVLEQECARSTAVRVVPSTSDVLPVTRRNRVESVRMPRARLSDNEAQRVPISKRPLYGLHDGELRVLPTDDLNGHLHPNH